jgi:hypothetical protein
MAVDLNTIKMGHEKKQSLIALKININAFRSSNIIILLQGYNF